MAAVEAARNAGVPNAGKASVGGDTIAEAREEDFSDGATRHQVAAIAHGRVTVNPPRDGGAQLFFCKSGLHSELCQSQDP